MKTTGIKIYIIKQFVISSICAFILTFLTFIICFGGLHIISEDVYIKLLNYGSHNELFMIGNLVITGAVFVIYFFGIFMKRMDVLTDYINEMGQCVVEIAEGNLNVRIPIIQSNELGMLAAHINQMTQDLNQFIEKEHEWDQQKYNLITNLSHDLKTPLMSVTSFLEIIHQRRYESEEALQHYSYIAFEKAKQLKEAIDKLFELSKLNNSQITLNKETINMQELAEQVLMGFIPELESKQLSYEVKIMAKNTVIYADPILMVRMLENLIANAIKYGVGAKYVQIYMEEIGNKRLLIHVINDGRPIDKVSQEKIFDRFYQAEKNMDVSEGNGVGLAIVKTIVELHHGEIMVESNQEKTDFIISLLYT